MEILFFHYTTFFVFDYWKREAKQWVNQALLSDLKIAFSRYPVIIRQWQWVVFMTVDE